MTLKHAMYFLPLLLALTACDNQFSSYSNYDLSEAYYECQKSGQSAAGAQRCANIQRECEQRKKDSGFRC